MKKAVLLLLLVCQVFGQNVVKKASIETLDHLATEIRGKIDGNPRLAAGFVRLSFHDCVGEGRCDGCINYQEPDNAGIPRYTAVLNDLYEPVKNDITRADLYAYAGVVAANYASSRDAVFDMTKFKVGRHDCSESGDESDLDEHFPSNNFQNVEELHAYFNKEFGLSLQESVALMGAHSLGRMETANSGYEGPWVPGNGQNVLNSVYYREVVNVPWFLKRMPTNSAKHQWQRQRPSLGVGNSPGQNQQPDNVLLNSDAALAVNLQLNQDTGAFQDGDAECVMCPPNRRPPPGGIPCCDENTPGREICSRYVIDNPGWMRDFEVAFYKMIDNPDDDLSVPAAAPTTAPTEAPTEAPAPATPRPPRGGGRGGGRGGRRSDQIKKKEASAEKISEVLHDLQDVLKEVKKMV